jgi:hypothetical protein
MVITTQTKKRTTDMKNPQYLVSLFRQDGTNWFIEGNDYDQLTLELEAELARPVIKGNPYVKGHRIYEGSLFGECFILEIK